MLYELADVVLEGELVRLAVEVRAGGPHVVRKAVVLASRLLRSANVEELANEA